MSGLEGSKREQALAQMQDEAVEGKRCTIRFKVKSNPDEWLTLGVPRHDIDAEPWPAGETPSQLEATELCAYVVQQMMRNAIRALKGKSLTSKQVCNLAQDAVLVYHHQKLCSPDLPRFVELVS